MFRLKFLFESNFCLNQLVYVFYQEENNPTQWNIFLNCIYKWTITREAQVCVAVNNVTVLSWTIFSCAGDRLAQIFSSYV